jgi:hypothetical protein
VIDWRAHLVSSALSLIGGAHIGARALLFIKLIRFGYITRLSQWGGGGYFTRSNDFYLPPRCLEEEGGGKGGDTLWSDVTNLCVIRDWKVPLAKVLQEQRSCMLAVQVKGNDI